MAMPCPIERASADRENYKKYSEKCKQRQTKRQSEREREGPGKTLDRSAFAAGNLWQAFYEFMPRDLARRFAANSHCSWQCWR